MRLLLALLLPLLPVWAQPPPAAPVGYEAPPKQYLWREAEKFLVGQNWTTSNYWEPSAGLFIYPLPGAGAAAGHIDFDHAGPWAVWLRVRDETRGERQFATTVNGKPSYVVGGNDTGTWWWCALGVVEGKSCDVALKSVSTPPMDGWADCWLFTDDLGFVPPINPPRPAGYEAYNAAADADRGRRAARIWWPGEPEADAVGYFRQTFDLPAAPLKATLATLGTGPCVVMLNEEPVPAPQSAPQIDVLRLLRSGRNLIAAQLEQMAHMAGLKMTLTVSFADGSTRVVVTDLTWKASDQPTPGWTRADFYDADWAHPFARLTEMD